MHPVILDTMLGGYHLQLSSYTFFNLILNPLVVILVSFVLLRRQGCRTRSILLFLIGLSVMVIIFSRMAHYLLNQDYYLENGVSLFQWSASGFTMFGGFILAIPCILLLARWKRFAAGKVLDLITPGWALGIFFNKIGCFLNGCCFGKPTSLPWGLIYPPDSIPNHYYSTVSQTGSGDWLIVTPLLKLAPVQLYESMIGLVGCFLAWYLLKKNLPGGVAFLAFSALFSASRLGTHYIRFNPYSQYLQLIPWLYLICFMVASGLLTGILIRRQRHAHRSIVKRSGKAGGF